MDALKIESDAIFRRAALRLVPLILAMYIAAFLNRVNVSFAALTMNKDLGFSPEVFGWGTGIFFLGYLVFEVPSNLIMERVGARLWLSRIMITWAIVSMAFAFVQGPISFFVLRFMLGLAEAGFYPGILLYFTFWFPAATRARILAIFCMGIPVSNILGAPLSGWLLGVEGFGFKGWQWMYILKAFPPWRWVSWRCGACRTIRPRPVFCRRARSKSFWRDWRRKMRRRCMALPR